MPPQPSIDVVGDCERKLPDNGDSAILHDPAGNPAKSKLDLLRVNPLSVWHCKCLEYVVEFQQCELMLNRRME